MVLVYVVWIILQSLATAKCHVDTVVVILDHQ